MNHRWFAACRIGGVHPRGDRASPCLAHGNARKKKPRSAPWVRRTEWDLVAKAWPVRGFSTTLEADGATAVPGSDTERRRIAGTPFRC